MEKGCYIIIRGPAGGGKSTLSKRLAEHLNAQYIELDDVRAKHKLRSRQRDRIKANEKIIPEVKNHLERGRIVVIDDVFYQKAPLNHLIKNLPYQHFVFTLKAPLETVLERNRNREKNLPRKMIKDAYNMVMKFDAGIVIDNTKKLEKSMEKIISYFPKKILSMARKAID